MFSGVALALDRVPKTLIDRHQLHTRIYERGGQREVRFLLRAQDRILPVLFDGQIQFIRWGTRRNQSRHLPCTAWAQMADVEAGRWADREVQEVIIPANRGLDNGVWFNVTEGIRGLVVRDEKDCRVVYVLVEEANRDYQTLSESNWMPVLVGEKT